MSDSSPHPRDEYVGGLRGFAVIGAPILSLVAWAVTHFTGVLEPRAAIALGIALWTALWWITEAVPIPVASLLPLALLPMFGILDYGQVGAAYGHHLILLLLGGFMLSKAMEKSGTHRRIALGMVNACGGKGGRRLLLGFMVATAFLSMWISNSATTLMMLPMAVAVLQNSADQKLRIPLLLGIAYAANVGGIATPIGTPPNLVMIDAYEKAGHGEISFLQWMKIGLPVTVTMLVVIWLWVGRGIRGGSEIPLPAAGTWRTEERRMLAVFLVTALLWIFRSAPGGGWQALVGLSGVKDASVALLAAVALFCIPSGSGRGDKLLDWKTAVTIPWGMLVLMGAGICLGSGIKESGLSGAIAGVFSGLGALPLVLLLLCVALLVTFLTEITSNTATTNVLMPITAAAATASSIDPILLMLPAAISASCAFMLPVATIPNAVVFGTGEVPIQRMAREGIALNLLGAIVVTTICYFMLG